MSRHYVEPQETVSKHGFGVDYGATGRVLVRTKDRLLVWRKPGKVWSGIGMPHSYVPAYLHVVSKEEGGQKTYGSIGGSRDLMRGGRLTKERLLPIIGKIREYLNLSRLDVSEIDLKKTYVVE